MININTLTQNIARLTPEEQHQLFGIIDKNAQLLSKIIPNAPLLEYIVNGTVSSGHPVVQAYMAWKRNN
jgi:hypothetical protein